MKAQYESITIWQDKTFPNATPLSCVNHLKEEVEELKADIENDNVQLGEIADCFMLLFGVCNKLGLSFDNICDVLEEKHKVNLNRKWGMVNELGYVKHVD